MPQLLFGILQYAQCRSFPFRGFQARSYRNGQLVPRTSLRILIFLLTWTPQKIPGGAEKLKRTNKAVSATWTLISTEHLYAIWTHKLRSLPLCLTNSCFYLPLWAVAPVCPPNSDKHLSISSLNFPRLWLAGVGASWGNCWWFCWWFCWWWWEIWWYSAWMGS